MLKRLGAATGLVLGLAWAAPCAAQDVPYVELAAGYNFMRYQQLISSDPDEPAEGVNLKGGLFGDVAINLNHAVGVVGALTTNPHESGVKTSTFMGGFRFSARGFARGPGRAIGFFQILGGFLNLKDVESYTERAVQLGGGANITVTDHAGVRVEADFIRTFNQESVTIGSNYIRVSVGVMYGFGAH